MARTVSTKSSFSAAVTLAKDQGYTEPDPRDDLSGKDVARKALILARLAGWPLEKGWPALVMTVLIMGGVQLLCLGIIAEYDVRLGIKPERPVWSATQYHIDAVTGQSPQSVNR